MKNKNKITPMERLVRVGSVMIALAIVGVCFGIARVEDLIFKTVIFAVSGLLLFLGGMFIASVAYLKYHETHKRNYILYDKRIKGDIPVEQVDFELVRGKVLDYMSVFRRGKQLYVGELFMDTPWTIEGMKTLVCYELLYELAVKRDIEGCRTFLGYGAECSGIFSKYLIENKDFDLSANVTRFFSEYEQNKDAAKDFCEYVETQKAHIKKRVVEYVKENPEKFMM